MKVNGDDCVCADDDRCHDGGKADGAEDDQTAALLDLHVDEHGPGTGQDAATERSELLQRQVILDDHSVVCVAHARADDPHEDLTPAWLVDLDLLIEYGPS